MDTASEVPLTTREFTITIKVFGKKQKVRVEAKSMAEAIEKVQEYKRKLEAQ